MTKSITSQDVYNEFGGELFLFTLKKVKDKDIVNDILQNCFLKVHKNIQQLESHEKLKSWVYRIVRNEIADYFKSAVRYQDNFREEAAPIEDAQFEVCCFDRFIDDLPDIYREAITLTYIEGNSQIEVAKALGLSIHNVKARIRRGKLMLKDKFLRCCKYEVNKAGNLIGPPNCSTCS